MCKVCDGGGAVGGWGDYEYDGVGEWVSERARKRGRGVGVGVFGIEALVFMCLATRGLV